MAFSSGRCPSVWSSRTLVSSSYFGWAGNGHIGRLNLTHAFYQVVGTDEFNAIEAREVDVNAQMAAVELSVDKDWLRIKGSFFWASGDDDINDGEARGFDSIVDIPVFAGGPFSVWNRQGLRLTQTNTGLVSPFSLLPDLRTNKDEGQQNFVNPGIVIVHGGVDVELTPKLRAFTTVSGLRFHTTAPLEALLFQTPIGRNIGIDFGGGGQYHQPLLSENMVITAGASALRLGNGLRDIYDGRHWFVQLFAQIALAVLMRRPAGLKPCATATVLMGEPCATATVGSNRIGATVSVAQGFSLAICLCTSRPYRKRF